MRPVTRLGELYDPADDQAVIASDDAGGEVVGVATYRIDGAACELGTLYAVEGRRRAGVGSRLVDAVVGAAREAGCRRVWLVTTNDNVDALRFYQRRGFRLAELHAGAVDRSRATLKPSIPAIGEHGIPIRDELVLEREL
jgi:ribosomal protein S18 acetylase RimI-like enzyme